MPKRILLIEDDTGIRNAVVDALTIFGYETECCDRAEEGFQRAMYQPIDLVLLDLVLPNGDGRSVLRRLREQGSSIPVVIMTACGFESDRIAGLKDGADDYVVKPFSIKELVARVEAVLRRSPQRPLLLSEIQFEGGAISFERREVILQDGNREPLSERECELLSYLARNCNRAISRDEILQHVWKLQPNGISTRTIDMHIARLREKLGDDLASPKVLATVRGKGYMFQSNPDPSERRA